MQTNQRNHENHQNYQNYQNHQNQRNQEARGAAAAVLSIHRTRLRLRLAPYDLRASDLQVALAPYNRVVRGDMARRIRAAA